jgi:hypothetical protein
VEGVVLLGLYIVHNLYVSVVKTLCVNTLDSIIKVNSILSRKLFNFLEPMCYDVEAASLLGYTNVNQRVVLTVSEYVFYSCHNIVKLFNKYISYSFNVNSLCTGFLSRFVQDVIVEKRLGKSYITPILEIP